MLQRLNYIKTHISSFLRALNQGAPAAGQQPTKKLLPDFHVYVINLERGVQRRQYIQGHLNGLGIEHEIFNAIDGKQLDYDEQVRNGIYDSKVAHEAFARDLNISEIAITLSHIQILEDIIAKDIQQALILEDDAMFLEGAETKLNTLFDNIPEDWEVIQLFHHCDAYESIAENVVKFNNEKRVPVGSAAYFLKQSAARKILDQALPIRYPADSFIGRCMRWGVNVYGAVPAICQQNTIFPTQIEMLDNVGLAYRVGNKVRTLLVKLLFKIK